MKKHTPTANWFALVGLLLGSVVLTAAPCARGDDSNPIGTDRLAYLAETGHFDLVLSLLKGNGAVNSKPAVDLIEFLERHQDHHRRWMAQRHESFDFAFSEMKKLFDAGQIEDAMLFAIEGHGLATDGDVFLTLPQVTELIDRTRALADAAEEADEWLEALDLNRRLDLLFDDPASPHRARYERVAGHIRVIRLYNPDQLKMLYEQRALRRGESIDPIHFGEDTWEVRLGHITRTMLIDVMRECKRRHISGTEHKPLLLGAIEALQILIETHEIRAVFPSLQDPDAVRAFGNYLAGTHKRLAALDGDLSHVEIKDWINRIFDRNNVSIKLPEKVLIYEMSEGALNELDDFTSVIWPYEIDQFRRNTQGKFVGVGIQITMLSGPLTVIDLDAESAAYRAGIRKDDVIAEIDGRDVSGYSAHFVKWKVREDAEDGVTLGIERNGADDLVEIRLPGGIPISIKRPAGRLTVKSPLRGTPAFKAGIQADDIIANVDAADTSDWTLDQAVRRITGKRGTTVTLGIRRKGIDQLINTPIRRGEIEIESVKGWQLEADDTWDFYLDRDQKIGYVRLSQFIPQSSDEMNAAINEMDDDLGLNALVLDLRFNPGGLLNKAIDVADAFIRRGTIVVTVYADGEENERYPAKPQRTHRPFPLVVLINRTSASASEIVAGALQDYGRATVIGNRSYGKGSVQDPVPIGRGRGQALLKLTTQYYRLPNRRIIHRTPESKSWGVEPDLVVDMTDDQVREALTVRQRLDVLHSNEAGGVRERKAAGNPSDILTKGLDPQLAAALLVLKTRLVAHDLELARNAESVLVP